MCIENCLRFEARAFENVLDIFGVDHVQWMRDETQEEMDVSVKEYLIQKALGTIPQRLVTAKERGFVR